MALYQADAGEVMRALPEASVEAIVTDPPYFLTNASGSGFMGKAWDSTSLSVAVAVAVFKSALLVTDGNPSSIAVDDAGDEWSERLIADARRVEDSSDDPQVRSSRDTSSALGLVITRDEAVALCSELSPSLTVVLRSLPSSALFAMSRSRLLRGRTNITAAVASIWLEAPAWLGVATRASRAVEEKNQAIVDQTGRGFGDKSTPATVGGVAPVTNVAGEGRSSATTSFPTSSRETTERIISSPFVSRVTREFTNAPTSTQVLSESLHRNWAREALRVLKPGGHLVAFGGTRTHHRLACALEDAGFEIRDCLMWLYGCLTEDTEILAEDGWKRGTDVQIGERVAQWDEGRIEVAPVLAKVIAPYVGPLIRLVNHDTDQRLTPNHRVYHRAKERVQRRGIRRAEWSGWRVLEASALLGWQAIRLPLAGVHDGDGIGGPEYAALLGWVWTEGGFDRPPSTGVRIYQSSTNAGRVAEIAALLDRLVPSHKRYDRKRTWRGRAYTETCWFFTGPMAARVRADLPGKHPGYALIWRMTLAEKRVFWLAAMAGDGSGYQFYQRDRVDLEWAQALLASMGQRGRLTMRSNRRGGAVTVTPRPETELQARHLRRRHVEYDGRVWCVRVPSGAFVARRNGQVFVTGNSGFPKSLDVSKAIDKAARGVPQGAIDPTSPNHGKYKGGCSENNPGGRGFGAGPGQFMREQGEKKERDLVPEALPWSGWGTALKPAWEPILLARKPLAEPTVAANVLKHGTGAINVDGCRITANDNVTFKRQAGERNREQYRTGTVVGSQVVTSLGRWPANVVLSHTDRCERIGEKRIRGSRIDAPSNREFISGYGGGLGGPRPARGVGDAEGKETVEVWKCAEDCPVRLLDEQRGDTSSARASGNPNNPKHGQQHSKSSFGWGYERESVDYRDTGGASRFFYSAKADRKDRDGSRHPTVKSVDLCKWLVRLVTPPGGLVLDPFMGSGPIVWAARELGFRAVGVDREAEYVQDAVRRLQQQILWDAAAPARPVEGVDLPEPEQLRLDGEAT